MDGLPSRRGFLRLTGASAAVSVAGCSQLQADEDAGSTAGAITAVVEPPEAELAAIQETVAAELDAGDLDREEAQAEMQRRQRELVEETAAEFQSTAEADADLEIEDSVLEMGLFLLDASAEALVGTLRDGSVDALLPGEAFAELQAQAP
ncbi:hypothetical protein [Salinilacihabitans rarus]|uniref:hypothetical protein n=1 Tax=Salinilacihabitans rarus TaxID=2961596 RepID=UPI0020C91A4F|nr:hypothetical protein [Salinilacihabitans rarus]